MVQSHTVQPHGVPSHSVLDALAGPLVLCVGTSTDHFAAVAEATGGEVTMLYLPDADSVRRLLSAQLLGHPQVPAQGHDRPADHAGHPTNGATPAGNGSHAGNGALAGPVGVAEVAFGAMATAARPAAVAAHRVVECGKLRIDADLREATWHGSGIQLSAREFDLLLALACDPGRVWTFAELTTHVWRRPYLGDTDAVVSAVKRLRRQVSAVTRAVSVESVRGVGYRLVVADDL